MACLCLFNLFSNNKWLLARSFYHFFQTLFTTITKSFLK